MRIYLKDSHWLEYLRYRRLSRLSRSTHEKIRIEIGLYFSYLKKVGIKSINEANEETVSDYLLDCKNSKYWLTGRKRSVFTIAYKRMILWNYYEFLQKNGYYPVNPFRNIPPLLLPKKIPPYLSTRQIIKLFKVAVKNKKRPTQFQIRLRAYMSLLFFYGLTNHEVFRIRMGDLDFSKGTILIRRTRTHDRRTLPIFAPVTSWLKDYIEIRPKRRSPNLFQCVKRKSHYSYFSSRRELLLISRKLHFPVSASIIRNTFFVIMSNNRVEHRVIQAIVGCHTIRTIKKRASKSLAGKRETVEKYLQGIT